MNEIKGLQPFNFMIYETILQNHRAEVHENKQKADQFDQINDHQQIERD